jgi:hypothetical protein
MRPSILLGLLLVAICVAIHSLGTSAWILYLRRMMRQGPIGPIGMQVVLCLTAVLLLFMHVIQVLVWAIAYLHLKHVAEITSLGDAVYFSIVTFTTLGFGDITITGPWRLLSGIEAMNGILLFGWSAALLFAVVQQLSRAGRETD